MEEAPELQAQAKKSRFSIKRPIAGFFSSIKNKLIQYKRVLSVARKPDKEEFISSMKITGSSLLFIGLIGFIIFLLYYLLRVLSLVVG